MNSWGFRKHVQLLAWICPWSLDCILWLPLSIFMGLLNVNMWVSVSFALSRALLFLFTCFVQSLCVIFVLTYYILTILLSLRSLFVIYWETEIEWVWMRRKILKSWEEERKMKLFNLNILCEKKCVFNKRKKQTNYRNYMMLFLQV